MFANSLSDFEAPKRDEKRMNIKLEACLLNFSAHGRVEVKLNNLTLIIGS